ncbi:MAG: hypothetical protein AB1414_17900, partial [bacterium]
MKGRLPLLVGIVLGIIGILVSIVNFPEQQWKLWIVPFQLDKNALIVIVSILLALYGLWLAIRQIELAKEVEVLEEMPEIANEIVKRIRKAKNIFSIATTPAIGASGAPDEVKELEKILIGFSQQKKQKPQEMCFLCYSETDIMKFYKAHKISYKSTDVERITKNIIGKINDLKQKGIAKVLNVEYCKIPILHFLLVDPESKSREKRRAVLWYLEASNGKVIKGTGFSTNN